MDPMLKHVNKKVLCASNAAPPKFGPGARITFHFKTERSDVDSDDKYRVIDDSKRHSKPMQLLLGKQFKMPVWEYCLRTMRVGEIAQFTITQHFVDTYPVVSQGYRQYAGIGKPIRHRCCGLAQEQTGHDDLDKFVKEPCDLIFTFELLSVEEQDEYEKEAWSMTEEEKVAKLPFLREKGNSAFAEGNIHDAERRYAEALGILEGLMLAEKPQSDEWLELDRQKIPFLLNYAQCKLLNKDYYEVIRHTTEVLEKDPKNSKALYRRAKAHIGAWNPEEARADLNLLAAVEPGLRACAESDLRKISDMEREKKAQDAEKMKKAFGSSSPKKEPSLLQK